MPPLFKVEFNKKEEVYLWSKEALADATANKSNYIVSRHKGLGEMNASELWETTMSPNGRSLVKVSINDAILAEKRVSILMGDKVEPRKEWIDENVEFSMEDDFTIK